MQKSDDTYDEMLKLFHEKLPLIMESETEAASLWADICAGRQSRLLSPAYEGTTYHHSQRIDELTEIAQNFIASGGPEQFRSRAPIREEVASRADSYFPRGWYCPSPVRDYVIGNCHRGRLLKRVTSRSKVTNRYLFDERGLYLAETYFGSDYGVKSSSKTEFLLRSESSVIGITVDSKGIPNHLSEEIYEDGLIRSYFEVHIDGLPTGKYETYIYDEHGLLECTWQDIVFGRQHHYRFVREDGCLKGYFDVTKPDIIYRPSEKRLCKPPFLV